MEAHPRFSWPRGLTLSDIRSKPISSTIHVHQEFRRPTHHREGDNLVNSIYKDTGCIVVAHWEQRSIKRFDVFGGGNCSNAVAAINKWIARGNEKSTDAAAWAKMPAFNHDEWYQEILQQEEEEHRERFLGPVPAVQEGEPMRQKIVVEWPQDLFDQELTPRSVFGNELKKLNDIRKRDKVFITLLPNNAVEILGFEVNDVEAAESHYRTLVGSTRVKTSSVERKNMILDEREGIDVVLVRAERWWPNHHDMVVPQLLPSVMMDAPGTFRDDDLSVRQLEEIETSIGRFLEVVSYNKGAYDFAVRLGAIALDSTKVNEKSIGKKHGKELFIKSIHGAVDLRPKKWLFDHMLGTQLYHHLISAGEFLESTKTDGGWGTTTSSLGDTKPSLRGTWVFSDSNSVQIQPRSPPTRNVGRPAPLQQKAFAAAVKTLPSSLIVVQIDWSDDGDGGFEKTGTRFYKLDAGRSGPKVNMEVNLLELGESRAWSFTLESMTPIPSSVVPPVLIGFANRVIVKSDFDSNTTKSFAEWNRISTVVNLLQHGRLDKIYSFGVQKTCYNVELTAMWYPGQLSPCWGLAIRHTEWATHLAELEKLQTGHRARWGNIINTFLPNDGGSSAQLEDDDFGLGSLRVREDGSAHQGISTLIDILLRLSKIVNSVTTGEDDGGVQI